MASESPAAVEDDPRPAGGSSLGPAGPYLQLVGASGNPSAEGHPYSASEHEKYEASVLPFSDDHEKYSVGLRGCPGAHPEPGFSIRHPSLHASAFQAPFSSTARRQTGCPRPSSSAMSARPRCVLVLVLVLVLCPINIFTYDQEREPYSSISSAGWKAPTFDPAAVSVHWNAGVLAEACFVRYYDIVRRIDTCVASRCEQTKNGKWPFWPRSEFACRLG